MIASIWRTRLDENKYPYIFLKFFNLVSLVLGCYIMSNFLSFANECDIYSSYNLACFSIKIISINTLVILSISILCVILTGNLELNPRDTMCQL